MQKFHGLLSYVGYFIGVIDMSVNGDGFVLLTSVFGKLRERVGPLFVGNDLTKNNIFVI